MITMSTIEERAKETANKLWDIDGIFTYSEFINTAKQIANDSATDQDRIARQEERERCIKAAQNWYCDIMRLGYYPTHKLCNGCDRCEKLRKAIEKGVERITLEEFEKMAEEHGKKHGGIRCLTRYPSYQDGGREYMLALYNDGTYETRRA